MAGMLESPVSPMSGHAFPAMKDDTSKVDMSHLSGMTLSGFVNKEPQIHLINASNSSMSKRSSMLESKRSSRASRASTTKSELRHSNHLLVEMLQNIQTELAAHRSILLDVQHRVSHLEYESNASVNNDAPLAALRALEGNKDAAARNSKLIPPETSHWWQACQNFARNSEPPISATEFLRTPRFSGIDWQYGPPSARQPNTPLQTPPDVEDLPPLTPTSDGGEYSDVDTPTRHDITLDEDIEASTPITARHVDDDIREHTVEVDKRTMPAPPALQPAPSGKPVVVSNDVIISSIEPELNEPELLGHPDRYYKGVKSLRTFRALLKNKGTDKEHHVLIHFHRRADLKDLDEE